MPCLDTLTPAQWATVAQQRANWLAIGTATGATDRVAASPLIAAAYQQLGQPIPSIMYRPSPQACLVSRIQLGDQAGPLLAARPEGLLWSQRRDRLRWDLWRQVCPQLSTALYDVLWETLGERLWAAVSHRLRDVLREQLRAQLGDLLAETSRAELALRRHLEDMLWHHLGRLAYGAHEAYWIGFFTTLPLLGLTLAPAVREPLRLWECLAQHCGWIFPYERVCLVADRPCLYAVDAHGRLHSATGPALAFPDGFALWAWHGVCVPQPVIEHPARLTLAQVQAVRDPAQQRVYAERYGWSRYVEATPALLLDTAVDARGRRHHLYRSALGTVLLATGPAPDTPGHWDVPPDVVTCAQALAWLASAPDTNRPSWEVV